MNDLAALGRDFEKRALNEKDLEYELAQKFSESSLQSTATRKSTSSAGSTHSSFDSVDSDEGQTKILGFYEGLGWKRIVFLPYNTLWWNILVATIVLHFFLLVYGYHFPNDETKITFHTKTGAVISVMIELMYFIDTAMAIIYKNWKSIHKLTVNIPRPLAQLVCDVLAIIPIEYIFWGISTNTPIKLRVNIYYGLTSHSLIRIYRVFDYFSHHRNHLGYNRTLIRLIEISTYSVAVTHAVSAIHFIFWCINKDEQCYLPENDWSRLFRDIVETDFEWYITSWFIIVGCFTFKVGARDAPHILSLLCVGLVYTISFVLIFGFMMGQLIAVLIQDWQYIFAFADRIKVIKHRLRQLRVPEKVYNDVITYYHNLWKERGGVHQSYLHYELLPNILHRDLNLDIFGDMFKRSHLLRTASESFLSFLSLKVKAEFFLPGDIIYRKDKTKSKMIYLINGIIQILTEEDDESPIISFSGGTCLGEAALIMTCVSKVVVRCATNCEVQVIEKSDFLELLKKYPDHKHSFKLLIQARIDRSKELQEIGRKGLEPTDLVQMEDNNESTVKWLKNFFLSSAQLKTKRYWSKHHVLRFENVNTDVHRTLAYLDLYVFTEKLELTSDDVCLRPTCPWILQPNSTVQQTWNNIIVVVAVVVAIVLPYNSFYVAKHTATFIDIMWGVEILYIMDLVIQTCTAIKTKTELIANWKGIFLFRLSELTFIADIIAIIPSEIMPYMLHTVGNQNLNNLFMLNKLIKLWKVERFFNEQETKHLAIIYHLREVKHLYHLLFTIYMFGGIFLFQSCFKDECQTPGWYNFYHSVLDPDRGKAENFTLTTLWSATEVTGTSFLSIIPISMNDIAITTLAELISFVFVIYLISSTAAMDVLYSKNWSMFQEKYMEVTKNMDELKMDSHLKRRVFNYMDFCWTTDKATSLISGRSPVFDLTQDFRERVFGPVLVPHFERVPLFKGANPQLLIQLANASTRFVVQPNETIMFSGEPATNAYIIMQGYCHGESSFAKNNAVTVFGPNDMFNAVEMFMKIPNINTVRTITCCQLLQIRMSTLTLVLKRFPESDLCRNLLSVFEQWTDTPDVKRKNNIENIFPTIETEEEISSWYIFSSKQHISSLSDFEYIEPFRKLRSFSFIKLFLLGRTMVPDGSFIIRWEISRAIFAFISAMLFPAAGALEVYLFPWVIYIRYALDLTAYVDLYIRLHVAFYDHRGIVVTHPLATAKHYLTHGFLLDLFAVLPFELLTIKNDNLTLYYGFLFNRVFQVFRMLRLFAYGKYSQNKICSPNILTGATFLVFGTILCNVIGGIFVFLRCEFTLENNLPDRFEKGIYCEYWKYPTKESSFTEPLSPVRVYLYNVYMATSIFAMCGLPNTMMSRSDTAIAVICVSILGFYMTKLMYAKIITITSAVDVKSTSHHEKIKSLINFIKSRKISKEFQEEVINYFELLWKRKRAMNAYNTFDGFNFTLKEDLFLHIYAKRLLNCNVFASADRSFLCHLILSGHIEVFLRGSTIFRPYERTNNIYFVIIGSVELIAAGNVKACPSITAGCMFGNLPNANLYSQSLTVVARTHVELLAIPCKVFHKQISLHPRIQKVYNVALKRSPSDFYMHTNTDTGDVQEGSLGSLRSSGSSSLSKHLSKMACGRVLLPNNQFMKAMLVLQLTASYLTFFVAGYFFSHNENSLYYIGFLYVLDLVFYIRIGLNFRLAYHDDLGYLVTEPEKIVSRYMSVHTKIGFYYDVAAIIPIEAFGLLAPESYRILVISALRLNRWLTVIYVLQWFWEQNRKLKVSNTYLIKFGFIFVWITLIFEVIACAMGLIFCIEERNCLETITASSYFRVTHYFYTVWRVFCMFLAATLAPGEMMPNSEILIIYCILLLLFTRLMAAFVIGEACAIVSSSCSPITNYMRKVAHLWHFYRMNDLTPTLQKQLWSYLKLLWDLKKGEQVPRLMTEAPYFLRETITSLLYGEHVQRISIFAECHEDFLRQLVTCLKQNIFFPGNFITFAGDMDDNMYFIYSGEIEYLEPEEKDEEEQVRGKLVEGDAFGLITGVYPQKEHFFNYRARTVAIVLVLHRADWENMLDCFPAVKKEIFGQGAHFDFLNL